MDDSFWKSVFVKISFLRYFKSFFNFLFLKPTFSFDCHYIIIIITIVSTGKLID